MLCYVKKQNKTKKVEIEIEILCVRVREKKMSICWLHLALFLLLLLLSCLLQCIVTNFQLIQSKYQMSYSFNKYLKNKGIYNLNILYKVRKKDITTIKM